MVRRTFLELAGVAVLALPSVLRRRVAAPPTKQQEFTMEIKRNGSQPSSKGPAEWFTGTVRIDPLFQANAPARAAGASVAFEPGARTAWHTHPLGQILIVTAGCGRAQRWGGPVDALLTLLVRPVVRNYNVAAGAHKQERDERTYIRGAFGRFSRGEDNRAEVQFLRPGTSHYPVLLACFRNEARDRTFTVALVLYLNSEGKAEKVYCFAPEERSIATDCAGLAGTERLRQQMEKRGFRATTSYADYHAWFAKATGVRAKAMDIFNQTVAVKDIQSLNRFIRDHMLEAKPWGEKVDSLLSHFTQLSEAHQSLVRIRRQSELLEPLAAAGAGYREHAGRLSQVQRLLGAADSFFQQKTVDLLRPECERRRHELARVRKKMEELAQELVEVQEECRRLTNEIERAGGERLRQIPFLIRQYEAQAAARRSRTAATVTRFATRG